MLSSAPLLTLIGVFITRGGILVGADTAADNRQDQRFEIVHKICQSGPRSVAALSGATGWYVNGKLVDAYERLRSECEDLRKNSPLLSVTARGARLGEAIAAFASASVPAGQKIDPKSGPFRMSIVVAGFDSPSNPVLAGSVIAESSALSGPRFIATPQVIATCSTMLGELRAVEAIRSRTPSLPTVVLDRPDVAEVLRVFRVPPCEPLSESSARSFFQLVVSASFDYAERLGIVRGRVNWPITFALIPSTGNVRFEPHAERPKGERLP